MKSLRQKKSTQHPPVPKRAALWRRIQRYEERQVFDRSDGIEAVRFVLNTPKKLLHGRKIAYLSDLHYDGSAPARKRLAGILRLLRRHPVELLLLGGDQCGAASRLDEMEHALALLAHTVPAVAAVAGNWERGKNWISDQEWGERFRRSGVVWLNNESWENEFVRVYGSDDLNNGMPAAPLFFHDPKGNLLLVHEPDAAPALDRDGALQNTDLILAGHTHGGQVRIPFFGSIKTKSRYGRLLDAGVFRHVTSDLLMYVSVGAGHLSFPCRVNCPGQVVWLEFAPGIRKDLCRKVVVPELR